MAQFPAPTSPDYFSAVGSALADFINAGGLPTCADCQPLMLRVIDPLDPYAPVDENTQYEPYLDEHGNPKMGPAYNSPALVWVDEEDPTTDQRVTIAGVEMTRRRGHAEVTLALTTPSVADVGVLQILMDWDEDYLRPIIAVEFDFQPLAYVGVSELPKDPVALAKAIANEPEFVNAVLTYVGL